MRKSTLFIGLDEAKDSIAVAVAEPGRDGEVRDHGTIANTPEALTKLVRKLGRPRDLHFAVEAGPCGYETYRHLKSLGAECLVVAPSKMPRRPGDRIKNDRQDAATLARLHRAGELTAVPPPGAADLPRGVPQGAGGGLRARGPVGWPDPGAGTAAAWGFRHPARRTAVIRKRLEGQPEAVQEIAWKAQVRLCGRYRKLMGRGKHHNKVITAIARELLGFLWATARLVQPATVGGGQ